METKTCPYPWISQLCPSTSIHIRLRSPNYGIILIGTNSFNIYQTFLEIGMGIMHAHMMYS